METYTVDYSIPQEDEMEQVFIINYLLSVDELIVSSLQVDENYDPTEFFSGIGGGDHNGQANGANGSHADLQDDLAVSDDSDEEKEREEDPMAF